MVDTASGGAGQSSTLVPMTMGLQGYHQANISRHNVEVRMAATLARTQGSAAVAVAPVPAGSAPQGPIAPSGSNGGSRVPTGALQQPRQVDLSAATVLDPRSTARARGRGIAHLTSSDTLGSKSMLRASASFIPSRTDFQALANSSVGGNGLPRPYGRFLAAREGNGLAVWERLPPYQPAPLRSGPLPEGEPDGRNVTQINVEQGRLLQRNLNHDTVSIDSSYVASGKDVLENWPDDLKRVDKFARPRPHVEALANPLAGYREGVDYSLNPPSGATFLVRVPEMPPTVKVDSSSEFERSFLHPLRGHSKGTIRGGRAHKSRVAHMLPPEPGAAS